jgi:hypothetical protein
LSASSARSPSFPPIGLPTVVAKICEGAGGALYLGAARATELPKLGSGALVMKDEIIEFEGVYFTSLQLLKTRSHALQESQELLLVISGDHLSRGFTTSALSDAIAIAIAIKLRFAHAKTVPIRS